MPTFKIVLYKQKTLTGNNHPVMLQVVNDGKVFRMSLGFKCKPEQWDFGASKFKRNVQDHVKKNGVLRKQLDKAESVWTSMLHRNQPFTPALFKQLFKGEKKSMVVKDFIEELVAEFRQKGQVSNRSIYNTLNNSLQKFWGKKRVLMFPDINYQFLKKFEAYLFGRGATGGGVHHYMRTMRAVYNQAIQRGYADEAHYPFSTARNKKGYSLTHLKSIAKPRALSNEDLEKLKSFPVENYPHLTQSHNFFLFSYYVWGMNFIDMALLKRSDIYDGRIHYIRQKTGDRFSIPVSDAIQVILDCFPASDSKGLYLFPILRSQHKAEDQIRNRVRKCLRKFNLDMKEMGEILGIQQKITSYVIRHTFATTLDRKSVGVAKISAAMGHEDESTTKAYLKRLENTELDTLSDYL